VQNDTVLAFRSSATTPPTPGPDLRELVGCWNDEILPDLATTQGKKRSDVAGRLRRRLPELRGEGIGALCLRDLAEPLKRDARARWAALLGQAAGDVVGRQGRAETGGAVRVAPPDTGVDERESLAVVRAHQARHRVASFLRAVRSIGGLCRDGLKVTSPPQNGFGPPVRLA